MIWRRKPVIPPWVVTKVECARDRVVHVWFHDGSDHDIDLAPYFALHVGEGKIFTRIAADDEYFAQVFVGQESGTIEWPDGEDFAPETLWARIPPEKLHEIPEYMVPIVKKADRRARWRRRLLPLSR